MIIRHNVALSCFKSCIKLVNAVSPVITGNYDKNNLTRNIGTKIPMQLLYIVNPGHRDIVNPGHKEI